MGAAIFFADRMKRGGNLIHRLDQPGRVVDFALDQAFDIDGDALEAGTWRTSLCTGGKRKIKGIGWNKGYFFSAHIHENHYMEFETGRFRKNGFFTAPMAYPILKLISGMHIQDGDENSSLRTMSYIHSLFGLLKHEPSRKSSVVFGELKIIFEAIERLETIVPPFPVPSQLAHMSGIKSYRFQRGCLALFGQPPQQIIQHLKMKRAFEDLLDRRKTIQRTSATLGYRHVPNFSTAFHIHFGIKATKALKYRQD
jgi:AraC-like DNA-binding protein